MGIKNDLIKSSAFGNGLVTEKKVKIARALPKGRPMRWASLHHHSTFSYGDGFGMPDDHAERAGDIQLAAMALTEHGNMASHVKFEQAAQKAGIKPLYGIEFYMSPGETQRKNHLTVLARNAKGYNNLLRLNTHAFKNFYYYPTLRVPELAQRRSGLFILSGCLGSELATSLIGGKLVADEDAGYALGRSVAQRYRRLFGDSYFLEVQAFPELEQTVRVNKMIARLSRELKIPLVATMDCHYPRPEDRRMQQILHNVRPGNRQTLEDMVRDWGYTVPLCPPERDIHILTRLRATGLSALEASEALCNTEMIAQECTVTLPTLPMVKYPPRDGLSAQQTWDKWLEDGWGFRGFNSLPRREQKRYRERFKYEKEMIEGKGYVDYFLIVADAVRFAKSVDILVGPARGSAAASLVCYLLRVTEVNPMLFPNLVFERFVDVSRDDMPDVDLDFMSTRRGEVYDYLEERYGSGHVGNIGTFTMYKAKNSIDDCARVFHVPKWESEDLKNMLIERSSGDIRASATIEDTVEQFDKAREILERNPDLVWAMELEGNAKGQGVHAAGLVVANGPITDVCSILRRKVGDVERSVVELDKYDAERQGLIKMDFLGLNTIDLISQCMHTAGMTLDELYALPLEEPEVIDGFRKNDTVGIFQFDGRAMRQVCGGLKPDNFQEICDANALARPGPLHSGGTADYIDTKWGKKAAVALHPLLDDITAGTHHQIVYQEQILRIVREVGNFSWTHASHIRKIISKKLGEQEFNRQWQTFSDGAKKNGVDEVTARAIWSRCITAGTYAFNAAHCVSYGMIAYWTMYFKVNHPAGFYAAALNCLNDKKRLELLRDADRHGVRVLPPSYKKPTLAWTPYPKRSYIRAGLTQIPGIGERTATSVLEAGSMASWDDLLKIRGIGKATVEKVKTFVAAEDPFEIRKLRRGIDAVAKDRHRLHIPRASHTALEIPDTKGKDLSVVWYGMIAERNLRDIFESHRSKTGEELDPTSVDRPDLNEWVVMIGVDETESVSINIDRYRYQHKKMQEMIWDIKPMHDIVVCKGVKPGAQSARRLYVKEMWVVNPTDDKEEEED